MLREIQIKLQALIAVPHTFFLRLRSVTLPCKDHQLFFHRADHLHLQASVVLVQDSVAPLYCAELSDFRLFCLFALPLRVSSVLVSTAEQSAKHYNGFVRDLREMAVAQRIDRSLHLVRVADAMLRLLLQAFPSDIFTNVQHAPAQQAP